MPDLPSNSKLQGQHVKDQENIRQLLPNSGTKAASADVKADTTRAEGSNLSEAKASGGRKPRNTRKSVSFTADTKTESLLKHKSKTKIPTVKPIDPVISEGGFSEEHALRQQPVIPANESPEDAALRRQMIQYNLSEVNNIVAEMDLDDEASDESSSDAGSEEIPDDSSLDEDEDKFGRTKRRVLSDEYLNEMRRLEQKLNAKAIHNIGPNASVGAPTLTTGDEKEGHSPIQSTSNKASEPHVTKGVRFAEDLDIQSSPPSPANSSPAKPSQPPNPPKRIHANTIVERPYSTMSSATPPDECDEFDPAMVSQQVKTEYHKLRNLMIQRQGGFTNQEDGAEVPLTEAEGGPKKMSRFKAARLSRGGPPN